MTEPAFEEAKMPLMEHLIELRTRLIRSFVVLIVLFFVSYGVADHIYAFLVQPLVDLYRHMGRDPKLIFTGLHEAFFTYIKVSFFAAFFLSFPFIALQGWRFVAPGLYTHEKRALLPFLIASPVLFFMGGAMVYFWVMPLAFQFFLSFEITSDKFGYTIESLAKVDQYLSLVMRLIFAFGLCFELPVVLTMLARAGMVTAKGLAEKRKYAVVASFVAAAVLTPPDVISQIGLALPTILLYEVSIVLARMIEKNRAAEAGEEEGEDDTEDADETGNGKGAAEPEPEDGTLP